MSCIFLFLFQLFNVVVDTEKTGKQLLERGQLQRKVTFIPLNKIAARSINDNVVSKAKSLVRFYIIKFHLSMILNTSKSKSCPRRRLHVQV